MARLKHLSIFALVANTFAAPTVQEPLQDSLIWDTNTGILEHAQKKRPLQGRFLHITDLHPDRFYQVYASTAKEYACHSGQGPAGIYGAESSDCDSPIELVNKTMKWVEEELKDKIDFVVWTGDSARHDNDEDHPRNEDQVVGLNKFMVEKMFEVFGKHNGDEEDDNPNNDYIVPIIPTMGNNDILPHNIFRKGPNKWTRTYSKIWRQFIPAFQKHQFEQGGWFYVEVIPNKLAVFSLNTIYFFRSNAAADGCAAYSEPGYQQMEWLRTQLQFMRDRGMKVILTGHVPPTRENSKITWDETCWQKYTLWLRQYRDVIVTSIYGHFNYDHFILQDFKDLDKGTKKGMMSNYETEQADEDDLHSTVSPDYFMELRNSWSKLPDPPKSLNWVKKAELEALRSEHSDDRFASVIEKMVDILKSKKRKRKEKEKKFLKKIGGEFAERYAVSFVSASVVPNLFPTLRVFEYNITGLDSGDLEEVKPALKVPQHSNAEGGDTLGTLRKKYKFEIPQPPSKSSPPGPAYSPQTFSLVRYTQYLANLTHINNDFPSVADENESYLDATKWKEGKHKGRKPHSKEHEPNPRKFKFQVHYDTKDDDIYQLKDLTMPSIVDLARRIGNFVPEEMLMQHDQDEEEGSDQVAAEVSEDGDVEVDRKKKKHKKHKKKKKDKRRKQNEAWYTFVRRAFVEMLDPEELEERFGY